MPNLVFRSLAVLCAVLLVVGNSLADETPPSQPAPKSNAGTTGNPLSLASMAQVAGDLRKASEVIERLGLSLDVIVSLGNSLATMSSEFDPFGYKTAFRTIGQQNQTIQSLQQTIQDLQSREIERLRAENARLKRNADRRKRGDSPKSNKTPMK